MYSDETKDAIPISLSNLFAEKNCKEFLLDTLRNLVKREKKVDAYNRGENVSKDGDPALSFGLNFNKNLTAYSYFEAVLLGKLDDIHTFKPAYKNDSQQEITIYPKSDVSVIEKIFIGEDKEEEATNYFQNLAVSGFSLKTNSGTIFGKIYPSIDVTGSNTDSNDNFAVIGMKLRKKEVLTLEITNPQDIRDLEAFKNILKSFFLDYLKEQNNPFLDADTIFVKLPEVGSRKVLSLSDRKIKEGFSVIGEEDNIELVTTEDFVELEPHDMFRRAVELSNEFAKDDTVGSALGYFETFNNTLTNTVAKKLNLDHPYDIPLVRYSYRVSSSKQIHLYEDVYLRERRLPIPSREDCLNSDFFENYKEMWGRTIYRFANFVPNSNLNIESIPEKIRGGFPGLHIALMLIHDDKFNVPKMGGMAMLRVFSGIMNYVNTHEDDTHVVFSAFREQTSYPLIKKFLYDEKFKHLRNRFNGYKIEILDIGTEYNLVGEKFRHLYIVASKQPEKV